MVLSQNRKVNTIVLIQKLTLIAFDGKINEELMQKWSRTACISALNHKGPGISLLGCIRCKHNTRWHLLSWMKDVLLKGIIILPSLVRNAAGYFPG